MDSVIRNCFIVSVDPMIGDVDGGDILIRDGLIAAIGHDLEAADCEVIDGEGCIAIPGFVDAHRHLWEGGIRSATAEFSILDFIGNVRLFCADFFRPQDMYATSLQGVLEALNAGVTTIAEYCHNARSAAHVRESIRGARDGGGRVLWCFSFTELGQSQVDFPTLDARCAFLTEIAREQFAAPDGLLTLGVCPEEPASWTDPAVVQQQFSVARSLGARLFMHANSVTRPGTGEFCCDALKLKDFGVIGEDVILVHMGYTTDEEWKLLGEHGAHVCYTPETEYQMGLGWPNIQPAIDAGVNISIGVDITANNSADMFFQLRSALQVERCRQMLDQPGRLFKTGTPLTCAEALYWGTMGGAKACGMADKIGSLSVGKYADIVLLRADDISMIGWDRTNPAATVIQQAGVHSVETVLIGGKVVKRDGKLLADVDSACRGLREASEHVHAEARKAGGFGAAEEVLWKRFG